MTSKTLYVSATPGDYELKTSGGLVVEQIIRPTGLLDPEVEVRPVRFQVDDLLKEIRKRVKKKQRVLITTLTKKSAEDLMEYYQGLGVNARYMHSEVKTLERSVLVRDLRLGVYDVLIGINLLREGLDLPEVSLVAITDADKEGFLRSERSLIQTIGRAARNKEGKVILYADHKTTSIKAAIEKTQRRREIQEAHNKKYKIQPQSIKKEILGDLLEIYQVSEAESADRERLKKYHKSPKALQGEIQNLRKQMKECSDALNFETAVQLRDEIKRLQLLDLSLKEDFFIIG